MTTTTADPTRRFTSDMLTGVDEPVRRAPMMSATGELSGGMRLLAVGPEGE
jgi:hypothetical protein